MTAKVENYCMERNDKSIAVNEEERVCINCIWYEQYYRKNRGNISCLVATDLGNCLLKGKRRGALRQPCKEFEREERKRK